MNKRSVGLLCAAALMGVAGSTFAADPHLGEKKTAPRTAVTDNKEKRVNTPVTVDSSESSQHESSGNKKLKPCYHSARDCDGMWGVGGWYCAQDRCG